MSTPLSDRQVTETLEEAGFTESQVEALLAAFTVHHHSHSIDEVIGLEEQLDEMTDECEPEESEDDE